MRTLLLLWSVFLFPAIARGDGGTVRVSERAGPYQVTVFTAPTPLRAGTVDVSVFVQDAATGLAIPEVNVTIRATSPQTGEKYVVKASREAATNKLFQAATMELAAGHWQIDAEIVGERGQATLGFEAEVGESLPPWTEMAFWIGLPLLPVALFIICQRCRRDLTSVAVR